MNTFIYTVEIPGILHLILGLETKNFEDENPITARDNALIYLSEILIKAVEMEAIVLSEFEHENSTQVQKIEKLNQSPYLLENGILDFQKISEFEIRYSFNDYVRRDAFHNRGNPEEVLKNYGFLKISMRHRTIHHSRKVHILEIINQEQFYGLSRESRMIEKLFKTDKLELKPLFSDENFLVKLKVNEMRKLFFDKGNLYQKEILNTDKFLEIEKIYLSFLNSFHLTKYIYVPERKTSYYVNGLLEILQILYPSENKFEYYISLELEGKNHEVYHMNSASFDQLIHSKQGKLYIRDKNGAKEVTETTSLSEIFEIGFTDSEFKEIFKII